MLGATDEELPGGVRLAAQLHDERSRRGKRRTGRLAGVAPGALVLHGRGNTARLAPPSVRNGESSRKRSRWTGPGGRVSRQRFVTMPPASPNFDGVSFPPFLLDRRAGLVRRGDTPLALRPKTFAVLLHLVERPGELVTKRALLDAIWPGIAVTEDVVRQSVGELRVALGDERAAPRFIATVPRRGYRFVATLAVEETRPPAPPPPSDVAALEPIVTVVGRARERAAIAEALRAAEGAQRQVAFRR